MAAIRHVLTGEQFTKTQLEILLSRAEKLHDPKEKQKARKSFQKPINGLAALYTYFSEPSTRTRESFTAAGLLLGMQAWGPDSAKTSSSAAKGESIEDTIKTLNHILQKFERAVIVMRHPAVGAAKRAAAVSKFPIINAGDGAGEHPTQALLDALTIKKSHGRLNNLRIVMGGDLLYSRTVHSLAQLLSKFNGNYITFVSMPELAIGKDLKDKLKKAGVKFDETSEVKYAAKNADAVYWTRLQVERIDPKAAGKVQRNYFKNYSINSEVLKIIPKKAIIMHPLPQIGEIAEVPDSDPRNKIWEQVANGVDMRMALLEWVMKRA